MYDPITARFLQEDTYTGESKDPLSLNLYTYVSNNPLIYYDPTGHMQAAFADAGWYEKTEEYWEEKWEDKKKADAKRKEERAKEAEKDEKRKGAPSDAAWELSGLIPTEDLPEGTMAVAEVSYNYLTVSRGLAIVYDEEKYAIYTFTAGSVSYPAQLPIGYTYTYGTVTNVRDVEDYTGGFSGIYSGDLNFYMTGAAWSINQKGESVYYEYEGGVLNGLASGTSVSTYESEHANWFYYDDMSELPYYNDDSFNIIYRENIANDTWNYLNQIG